MATAKESHFNEHREQLRQKAGELGHNVQEIGRLSRDIAKETMGAFKENAGEYYQQGVERAKGLEKDLEGKIKENPMQSLLIALGLGFVVGWLFHRR
jgi:ElaB/YqjD/DUF883 family membrane-anchored ribosome-binding protein